ASAGYDQILMFYVITKGILFGELPGFLAFIAGDALLSFQPFEIACQALWKLSSGSIASVGS
ncbi:hypothetical protein K5M56_34780, partial [Serratia marcescens]|nr:hypothetical protein [Serratia marcescens]